MRDPRSRSLPTLSGAAFPDGALCIFAKTDVEPRASHPYWDVRLASDTANTIVVVDQTLDSVRVSQSGVEAECLLQDSAALERLVAGRDTYVDISGLALHVWAPLVRAGVTSSRSLWAVYVEPERYKLLSRPSSHTFFDLSETFYGVRPISGFGRITGPTQNAELVLVTLLGFEGHRPKTIATEIDEFGVTVPVVGVPGFRLEFPSHALACNREFLEEQRAFGNVRWARANCPFEARDTLATILQDHPRGYLFVAPLGPRPHALGAVLFAMDQPGRCELVYDHPVGRQRRSTGLGKVHLYCIKAPP